MTISWVDVQNMYDSGLRSSDRFLIYYIYGYTGSDLDEVCNMLDEIDMEVLGYDS